MSDLDLSKLRKKLARKLKQREKQPRPHVDMHTKSSPAALMKRMSRDHEDLLQNIEFALVMSRRQDDAVDDAVAWQALKATIAKQTPDDPIVDRVVQWLREARRSRPIEPDDNLWNDGCRVVMDSIRNHSQMRPGETHYFNFVSHYVR